jgi:hypothetical protein
MEGIKKTSGFNNINGIENNDDVANSAKKLQDFVEHSKDKLKDKTIKSILTMLELYISKESATQILSELKIVKSASYFETKISSLEEMVINSLEEIKIDSEDCYGLFADYLISIANGCQMIIEDNQMGLFKRSTSENISEMDCMKKKNKTEVSHSEFINNEVTPSSDVEDHEELVTSPLRILDGICGVTEKTLANIISLSLEEQLRITELDINVSGAQEDNIDDLVLQVIQLEGLRNVRRLTLDVFQGCYDPDLIISTLITSSPIDNLQELRIESEHMEQETVDMLAQSQKLANLRKLALGGFLDSEGFEQVLRSLRNLTELNVHDSDIDDRGIDVLVSLLPNLESLNLMNSMVTDDGVVKLVQLRSLKYLNLVDCAELTMPEGLIHALFSHHNPGFRLEV